jgi:hypothetical protein
MSTNEKNIYIFTLIVILLSIMSYTIYEKFHKREGFNLFSAFGKLFKFIAKIGDFLCWVGDVAAWCADTVAALFYYVGNMFSGCILFYGFDIVMGTTWYMLYIIFSIVMYGKEFTEISAEISDWMDAIDDSCYDWTGMHIFKYSDETTKKCYKLKFDPFPKWPF